MSGKKMVSLVLIAAFIFSISEPNYLLAFSKTESKQYLRAPGSNGTFTQTVLSQNWNLPDKETMLAKVRSAKPGTIVHVVISDTDSDADTVFSNIGENYRIQEEAKAKGGEVLAFPVIQGQINDETEKILKDAGINVNELIFLTEVESLLSGLEEKSVTLRITLTDHHDKKGQLAARLKIDEKKKFFSIIDHHQISDKVKKITGEVVEDTVGAATTLIFERFVQFKVPIPPKLATLMLRAILSDTKNKAKGRDEEAIKKLKEIAFANPDFDHQKLFIEQNHALNTLDVEKPLDKIFSDDNQRYFEIEKTGKYSFTTFWLNYDEVNLFFLKHWEEIVKHIQKDIAEKKLDVVFFNLSYLNKEAGLDKEGLYVFGNRRNVIKYLNASGIPYQDEFEEVGTLSNDFGIYRLEHKGKAARKEVTDKISTYFRILNSLEARNKEGLSNYPPDLREQNEDLFDYAKKFKVPIYSQEDDTIYVWDADGLEKMLLEQYAQGKNDEKMISIVTIDLYGQPVHRLAKGGAIFDFNFRKDRQKQWVRAILSRQGLKAIILYGIVNPAIGTINTMVNKLGFKDFKLAKYGFTGFDVPQEARGVQIYGLTRYIPELSEKNVVLEDIKVVNCLPELLYKNGKKMIVVFDAEKAEFEAAFRGGNEKPFPNEDLEFARISMPVLLTAEQVEKFQPDVKQVLEGDKYLTWFYHGVPKELEKYQIPNSDYWQYVGLSGLVVANANARKIKAAKPGTFGFTNISLLDLNGHVSIKNLDKIAKLFIPREDGTFEIKEGNGWDSALECLKVADKCVEKIMQAVEEKEGVFILVGDHGSLDDMKQAGHSFNDVPIFIIDFKNKNIRLVKGKDNLKDTQADVAVTVAQILAMEKPAEMTGKSLLPDDYKGSGDRLVWQVLLDGFGHTDFKDPNNAFGVAMGYNPGEGIYAGKGAVLIPTIKKLYDQGNYVILKACSWYAGLRGGRQEEFKKDEIKKREEMVSKIKELKPEKIKIINYDYKDVAGAIQDYDYEPGLSELKNSPFLNDKEFVVKFDETKTIVEVLCLDYAQMGSTEYNTWVFGGGRIVWQSVVIGDKAFMSGALATNRAFRKYIKVAQKQGYAHFVGISQEAAVHASQRLLYYLIKQSKENGVGKFMFDLGSDGRDEAKQDCLKRVRQLRAALEYFGVEKYAINIGGRELRFDRAGNWPLISAWVNELLWGSRINRRVSFLRFENVRQKLPVLYGVSPGMSLFMQAAELIGLKKINNFDPIGRIISFVNWFRLGLKTIQFPAVITKPDHLIRQFNQSV